jgi:hypothetical protein
MNQFRLNIGSLAEVLSLLETLIERETSLEEADPGRSSAIGGFLFLSYHLEIDWCCLLTFITAYNRLFKSLSFLRDWVESKMEMWKIIFSTIGTIISILEQALKHRKQSKEN